MSNSIYPTLSQIQKSRQIKKLQIPSLRKQEQIISQNQPTNNPKLLYHHHQNYYPSTQQKLISQKLTQVDLQNKKLIELSKRILQSSNEFIPDQKLNPLIYNIQSRMKSAFNQLIQSIQQFYIDIDSKIKQIGIYLSNFSGVSTHETSKNGHQQHFTYLVNQHQNHQTSSLNLKTYQQNQLSSQQNLKSISYKIQNLQRDLQQTKQNQKKLVTIIQKLVQKYEINHETTLIKQDPFFKKKLNNMIQKLDNNNSNNQNRSEQRTYIKENDTKVDRNNYNNTFAAYNHNERQLQNTYMFFDKEKSNAQRSVNNLVKNLLENSLVDNDKRQNQQYQKTRKNVPYVDNHHQHQNDYSLYQQLKQIEQIPYITTTTKQYSNQVQPQQQQRQFINYMHEQKSINKQLNKSKPKQHQNILSHSGQYGTSTVSINSYAVSDSISNVPQDQCFIKKLYSKQSQSLNKVSLKGCNNYFQFKKKQDNQEMHNKNHREAFLVKNLKK